MYDNMTLEKTNKIDKKRKECISMAENTNIETRNMGQELTQAVQAKTEQPENDRRVLMQNVYDTNMQAVKDGIEGDVMTNGTITEKRNFMSNVMSANLYGKQLATKDNPVTVPDIELDADNNIKLTLQEYTPPEVSYDLGKVNTLSNHVAVSGTMSKDEISARNSMKDVNAYVEAKQEGKGDSYQTSSERVSSNISESSKNTKSVANAATLGAGVGAGAGAAVGTIVPGVGTAIGAGVGTGVGVVTTMIGNNIGKSTKNVKTLVESRTSSVADKVVTQAINADKRSTRITQAEALSNSIESAEKSSEAEFV